MPIMSYLAYPVEGRKGELISELSTMPECEVYPAENDNVIVLVTDTRGKADEERLQKRLNGLSSLAFLALVSGYYDPERKYSGLRQ